MILEIADLFCGAGGTSTGAVEAALSLGLQPRLTAINHWPIAIETHGANHPGSRHLCTAIDDVNPRTLYCEGELDLLWASPECTHHSVARGGRPINDQSRATAFCVPRWAEALRPKVILVENVPEFESWGPLKRKRVLRKGKWRWEWHPIPERKGEIFRAWVAMLEAIGYRVGWSRFLAADYGDPTTRERLMIQAQLGSRRRVVWPNATHGPGLPRPWVPAREIIDWSIPGQSIFERKRPLVVKTIRRILAGFERFVLEPFLLPSASGEHRARSVERPLHTLTTEGRVNGLAASFLVEHRGTAAEQIEASAKSTLAPISTVAGSGAHHALVTADFLVQIAHGAGRSESGRVRSVEDTIPAICGNGNWAKATSFLVPNFGERDGQTPRFHALDEPSPNVTGHGAGALVSAILQQQSGGRRSYAVRSTDEPAATIPTGGALGLVNYLITIDHQGSGDSAVRGTDEPLSSTTSKARHSVLSAFLDPYYGTGTPTCVEEPVPTVTGRHRFGLARAGLVESGGTVFRKTTYEAWKRLVLAQTARKKKLTRLYLESEGRVYCVEITHRMLVVRELAGAQGFRSDYVFKGTKTQQVKQIGNAVPRRLTRALATAALSQNPDVSHLADVP